MEKAYTMAEEPYTRIYARIDLDAIVKNMEAMRENLPAELTVREVFPRPAI